MSFFDDVGRFLVEVSSVVRDELAMFAGPIGLLFEKGSNIILNWDRRHLTSKETTLMAQFFSDVDLGKVRVAEDAVLLAPPGKRAVTIGHDIFWEGELDICDMTEREVQIPQAFGPPKVVKLGPAGPGNAHTLMHELVHVRQIEASRIIFGSVDYAREVMSLDNA